MQIRTIQVPEADVVEIQDWLDSDQLVAGLAGAEDTITQYTVEFAERVEAEINVINSQDGPFIDAVWFDSGCEIGHLGCRRTLLGEYDFTDRFTGNEYRVIVEKIS